MKKVNAIFIDATRNLISDIPMDDHFEEISKLIGCDIFCSGARLKTGDVLYVDDMGWLDKRVTRAFSYAGSTFAGNGLILGVGRMSGATVDVKIKSLDVAKDVLFAPRGWEIPDSLRAKILSGTRVISLND
jgi:hypothetical protein